METKSQDGLGDPGYKAGGAARSQLDDILKTKYGDQADKVGLVAGGDMTGLVAGADMTDLVAGGIKSERQQKQEQDDSNKTKYGVLGGCKGGGRNFIVEETLRASTPSS
ncbi:unnamed protein product [Linum trigynum]|uniref:Uncharacterized protein n=1 Tax=Linum trigynum TaxID=586398 RepID=A0AAV2ER57_9ROSI